MTSTEPQAQALRAQLEAIAARSRRIEAEALAATIAYTSAGLHKSRDGFSGIRDWIKETFDFNYTLAGQLASVARLAPKFKHLTDAALVGTARVDAVAYAVRRLEREGLAVYARVPFKGGPVESPYDPQTSCATPEELIREYCAHAPFGDLARHLDEVCAELLAELALLDDLSQQTLQWLEVSERPDGMWDIAGRLTSDTGKLFANLLKTAVPPPRQEDADKDGILPRAVGRNAEALHQMLASYGTNPKAPTRHGHTATLSLACDLATLRGERTGRLPMLDGKPISVAKARFLACEAGVIPMVFDYERGEVVELGREERLPNTALRRKLEAEQPSGCAWSGCTAPVSWCEAHHVVHWADGGPTEADNLILLCRFHHGRIHTGKWNIEKTGPGQADITHTPTGCTDADWENDLFTHDFSTGLATSEYSPNFKQELETIAAQAAWKDALDAKAKARNAFQAPSEATEPEPSSREADGHREQNPTRIPTPAPAGAPAPPPIKGERHSADDFIPFLIRPQRAAAEGKGTTPPPSPNPERGIGPLSMPTPNPDPPEPNTHRAPPHTHEPTRPRSGTSTAFPACCR